MKKFTLLSVAASMLLSSAIGVSAAEIMPNEDGSYTVNAEVAGVTAGSMYGILAVKGDAAVDTITEADIMYIDQITATEAGKISLAKFGLLEATESTLYIGGAGLDGATEVAKLILGSTGVVVNGKAVSWNNTDDAVYMLYASTVEDADVIADIKSAEPSAFAYKAEKGEIVKNADNAKLNDQTFEFADVENGTYKLAIYKPGKYVLKLSTVTVTDDGAAEDISSIKLWLKGDVNYTGGVDYSDIQRLYQHIATPNKLVGEALVVANTNETGSVDYADIQRLYQHIATSNKFTD